MVCLSYIDRFGDFFNDASDQKAKMDILKIVQNRFVAVKPKFVFF